jgi:hypothetical protein
MVVDGLNVPNKALHWWLFRCARWPPVRFVVGRHLAYTARRYSFRDSPAPGSMPAVPETGGHPKRLRHIFTIISPIAVFFGLTCSLLPAFVLRMYGQPVDDASIWVT